MPLVHQFDQVPAVDVRVDFGRRDVGVAEHRLQRAQVRAAFEQMRREGTPEGLGRAQVLEGRLEQLRDSVRDFVEDVVNPIWPEIERTDRLPQNVIDRAKDLGLFGLAISPEYGGLGLPVLDTALVIEEISKGCYVTAMDLMGEVGVQVRIISTYAPESMKRRILPKVCSGEYMLAVCMTEPHAGTDVGNYRTNTDIKGDRVILNGVKTLISRVDDAQFFVVFTRVNKLPGRGGIGCVLIEKGTPGFECTARYHTMGGENLAEIRFDNCELPLENLILKEGGFHKLINAFNTQRCLNPSVSLGLAEGAFEEAVKYARDRSAFGQPIGEFQAIRHKLAEMYREIEASRSVLYRAAASANPFPNPYLAAVAKITVNEMSLRVTSDAAGSTSECGT